MYDQLSICVGRRTARHEVLKKSTTLDGAFQFDSWDEHLRYVFTYMLRRVLSYCVFPFIVLKVDHPKQSSARLIKEVSDVR